MNIKFNYITKILNISIFIFVVSLSISLNSCGDIVTDCTPSVSDNNRMKANFTEIQSEVFNKSCATAGCHVEGMTSPNLTSGISYQEIVGVEVPGLGLQYIKPFDSQNSYLIQKMRGTAEFGSVMPTTGKLPDYVIDSVAKWVDNGALNN